MAENQNGEPLAALLKLAEQLLGRPLNEEERKLLYGWADQNAAGGGAQNVEGLAAYQEALKQTQATIRQGQAQTAAAIHATLDSIRQSRGEGGAASPNPQAGQQSGEQAYRQPGAETGGPSTKGPAGVRMAASFIARELEIVIAQQVAFAITESMKPLEAYLKHLAAIIADQQDDSRK